ncbi:unnamed protein product, partial [Polarella glacialis]
PASAWRRFGSSMRSECEVLVSSVLQCGSSPVFYDLFVEDVDGSLLPVPVRILNTVKDNKRPNLNSGSKDVVDDVLVRRFSLCDAVSGKDGGSQAYPGGAGFPSVVRWAAHAAIQVSVRPNTDGRIYMPVLSLAYADKRTDRLSEDDTIPVSFTAEYSMDPGNYWTVMTALLVLVILCILALAAFRVYLVERRYPSIPMPIGTIDPSLFAPKAVIQMLAFCSTVYSGLFWFHFVMALYWLITFKAQNVPHLLLPSALDGGQYEPHDVIMVIVFCFGAFTVSLGLWKQLRVFFFLVDWARQIPFQDGDSFFSPYESGANLFLGMLSAATSGGELQRLQCKHVVSVMRDAPRELDVTADSDSPARKLTLTRLHVNIADDNNESMYDFFSDAVDQIDSWLKQGKNVLVHCSSGISRSPTLMMAFLMKVKQVSLRKAYHAVRTARPCVAPGTQFFQDLQRWERFLTGSESNTMSLEHYHACTVQSLLSPPGSSLSFEGCLAGVRQFGYATDFALLQAAQLAAEFPAPTWEITWESTADEASSPEQQTQILIMTVRTPFGELAAKPLGACHARSVARPTLPAMGLRAQLPVLQGACRPYITVVQYDRSEVLAKLEEYHATVMSANWADYLHLVYNVPFWETELEKLTGIVQPYLHEPSVGAKFSEVQEMMDVLYQCEDVRDHINELAELATRASGFMGTGFAAGEKLNH